MYHCVLEGIRGALQGHIFLSWLLSLFTRNTQIYPIQTTTKYIYTKHCYQNKTLATLVTNRTPHHGRVKEKRGACSGPIVPLPASNPQQRRQQSLKHKQFLLAPYLITVTILFSLLPFTTQNFYIFYSTQNFTTEIITLLTFFLQLNNTRT